MPSDPIAFFITWTVYGTHLQGDERGWRRRGKASNFRNRDLRSGVGSG